MHLLSRFAHLRIRYKLLIMYSAIFVLSLALGNVTIYHFVRRNIESNIESELHNTTTTILNMVRDAAQLSIKNYLRAVAEKNRDLAAYYYGQYQSGKISEKEALRFAREALLSQPIGKTGYIYCLNSRGIIVNHPHEALMGADLSAHEFIQEQKKHKMGYIEYDWKNPSETHPRPKALYMTYFEPWDWIISASSYRDEFNELVNVGHFRESILSLQFGKTGYSYVIDTTGKLIIHPKLESTNIINERDAHGRYFIRELVGERSGKMTYGWKNPDESQYREKLVIFNHIPEFDWIVASSSYLDEIYAPLKTVERIFIFNVFFSLLLVLPLTLWISSTITNPLQALMKRLSQEAKGDISMPISGRSQDEISLLSHYFNAFMERLERYSSNLKAEIDERKKAESAIRKSETKYRELVQNANSLIMRIDTEGKITFLNEFAQSLFGFEADEVIGCHSVGTTIPEYDSGGRSIRKRLLQIAKYPDDHRYFEVENMRRNGERIWIAWTHKAIRDARGHITEYLCVGHDITESRAAKQKMAHMRQYLQKIVDSMPSMLVGIDLEGMITQWNQEAEKLSGIDRKSALGRPVDRIIPGLQSYIHLVHQAMEGESIRKVEKVPHPCRANRSLADIMAYPIMVDHVESVVLRIDDVTARVRMEDVMVQSEKMMSLGGLAAGMAHEINNPLGTMVQGVQNIMRRISPELKSNHQAASECGLSLNCLQDYLYKRSIIEFLKEILASGQKASEIVDNMLNFSRKSESRKAHVPMAALLDSTVSLAAHDYDLKKKYDFRHIRVERQFDPHIEAVPCVATEIEQVILNLLRNAAHSIYEKGDGLESPTICLRLQRQNGMAVIEVEDNGLGIPPHAMKRVFEPFYTTKDVGIGTGLGLSVSYFIITNNHNGTMEVESEPGRGSNFIIKLPMEEERVKAAADLISMSKAS